jgi:hypothetical protein
MEEKGRSLKTRSKSPLAPLFQSGVIKISLWHNYKREIQRGFNSLYDATLMWPWAGDEVRE